MALTVAPIAPEEVADLQAVVATLPYLRNKSLAEIAAQPVVLGTLRNVVHARREALAARKKQVPQPEEFELT